MNPKQSKAPLLKNECERLLKLVEIEERVRKQGYKNIAGIDEVGRGSLAGPLVAAAAVIQEGHFFPGINDSKLLSHAKRDELYQGLIAHPEVHFAVGIIESEIIDRLNIHQATLLAMKRAVEDLEKVPDFLLVDGLHLKTVDLPQEKVIKGDRLSQSIAAASIIAKEVRDRIMVEYHRLYPEYGFDENKGYGTKKHYSALKKYGPCPIHRRSYAPVREVSEDYFLNF